MDKKKVTELIQEVISNNMLIAWSLETISIMLL